MLEDYVQKIAAITRKAGSETSLQIKLEHLLSELLAFFEIPYEPSVNETLKSQGLSQADSTRPDSLFGHVVLDYKAPRLLTAPKEFQKAKQQIENYLDTVTGADHSVECQKWAGILWDGASLAFCHSNGQTWAWTELFGVSEASLLTLAGTYRALQRKPLTASVHRKASSGEYRRFQPIAGGLLSLAHRTAAHEVHFLPNIDPYPAPC